MIDGRPLLLTLILYAVSIPLWARYNRGVGTSFWPIAFPVIVGIIAYAMGET